MPAPSILPLINAAGARARDRLAHAHWYPRRRRRRSIFLVHARSAGSRDTRARHRRAPAGPRTITSTGASAPHRNRLRAVTVAEHEGTDEQRPPSPRATRRRSRPTSPTAASRRSAPRTTSAARRSPAQLSVLDLAEAHHAALRGARRAATAETLERRARTSCARASRLFETVHRGYLEVQEVARLEHEHVEQLRALADASVAINSSLTVEEILQLHRRRRARGHRRGPRDRRDPRARPAAAPAHRHLAPAPRRRRAATPPG